MLEPTTKIVVNKSTGAVKVDNQMLIQATVMHAGVPVRDELDRIGLSVLSEFLPAKAAQNLNEVFAQEFIAPAAGNEVSIRGQEIIDWLQRQTLPMALPVVAGPVA